MDRTRATTVPTPTPARQSDPELTVGAADRGGAVVRGHGRGRRRRPTRCRRKVPNPTKDRVVTPPPIEEVVKDGEEGEDEQIQDKEVPLQPALEMINQVITYLSGLSDYG